ncbi:hypothetical protein CMO89_04740 [Candidatus Woesearchaeota archaeon]|nr:hypothetical protein [Candidatus Woesearchaeota archaeon]|tara:strand:- start:8036 stop:8869 length:834 start_codon:yes stop_codon:yes gene_type:complete
MIRLKHNKKGFLFALGLTFLALVVMALAILIFHNAQKSEGIISELAVLDRIYDLDTSIQQSLQEIFNLKSDIIINITNNSISFLEELPNSNAETFNNSIMDFQEMTNSNLSDVNITINGTINELPLTIMPYDITYRHVNFGDRRIEVIPEQINFDRYSVFVLIDNQNLTSCDWGTTLGTFNLTIEATGQYATNCFDSQLIDLSEENNITINDGAVNIEIDNNIMAIVVNNASGITADVKTTIIKDDIDIDYIEIPSVNTKRSFGELGVYKESILKIG